MTELQKEINTAFGIINSIPVTGENQERAVMAKEHLRRAYKLTEPKGEKKVTEKECAVCAQEAAEAANQSCYFAQAACKETVDDGKQDDQRA